MRALALASLLIAGTAGVLPAATYHLNAEGTGDFPTIVAAIAAADPGDSILLAAGLYLGADNTQLDYGGKDIVIAGAGPGATILDCEDSGQPAVLFESGETRAAVLRDLTVRNNEGFYTPTGVTITGASPTLSNLHLEDFDAPWSEFGPAYFRGPALHIEDGSPLIENVEVRDCYSGGGVFVAGGAPIFEGMLVEDCSANMVWGGGILVSESAAVFRHVTVRGCFTYERGGGGVACTQQSSPTFEDCRFEGNWESHELPGGIDGGGGMVCWISSPTLRRCVFIGNDAADGGGGLECSDGAAPLLEDVLFVDNGAAFAGSAIMAVESAPILRGVTITGSRVYQPQWLARDLSSSIYCWSASPVLERVIVAHNEVGTGLFVEGAGAPSVVCSDFFANPGGNYGGTLADQTGLNGNIARDPLFCGGGDPDQAYAPAAGSACAPANNDCGVLIGALPVGCDLAAFAISGLITTDDGEPLAGVQIAGLDYSVRTDAAGGYRVDRLEGWSGTLTPVTPGYVFSPSHREYVDLQADQANHDYIAERRTLHRVPADHATLAAGIAASLGGDTVLVAPGTYAGPGNRNLLFAGRDLVVISEGGSAVTTLDCAGAGRGFRVSEGESGAAWLEGFTIVNGKALDGNTYDKGGGVYVWNSSPTLRDLRFVDCDAEYGGGLVLENSTSIVGNIVATGCTADRDGAGIFISGSQVTLFTLTLVGNSTPWGGGGIALKNASAVVITRALITANSAGGGGAIYCRDAGNTLHITCSDAFANTPSNYGNCPDPTGTEGNISADPLFCDAAGGDYTLAGPSPCLPWNNDCGVQMGVFGMGCETTPVGETTPAAFAFAAPQPNPFNPKTTLRYALPRPAAVDLAVFDVNGRRVTRLLAGEQMPAGNHAVEWNGRDEAGRALPSGVYFARFAAGSFMEERKLVLLR